MLLKERLRLRLKHLAVKSLLIHLDFVKVNPALQLVLADEVNLVFTLAIPPAAMSVQVDSQTIFQ